MASYTINNNSVQHGAISAGSNSKGYMNFAVKRW